MIVQIISIIVILLIIFALFYNTDFLTPALLYPYNPYLIPYYCMFIQYYFNFYYNKNLNNEIHRF